MALLAAVDVVDHRRKRGGFPGTGFAGDQNQAAVDLAQAHHCFRQIELGGGAGLGGNRSENRSHAVQLAHHVDAETGDARNTVGEIRAVLGLESLHRQLGHDFVQRCLHHLCSERFRTQCLELAVLPDARRIAG